MSVSGSGAQPVAEGITNPPIDDLLTKTDSKYKLVLYSAKRARQINAYYSQLGEGLLEYVGPLVDTHVQEKPLSIALREINADLLTCEDIDPDDFESGFGLWSGTSFSAPYLAAQLADRMFSGGTLDAIDAKTAVTRGWRAVKAEVGWSRP